MFLIGDALLGINGTIRLIGVTNHSQITSSTVILVPRIVTS